MPRNLALDGLRGVAVFMVILLHHNYLNVGWMGVDVFFALSGFLITSILRRMRADEHYWADFWIKRGTRILPPLILTIAMVPRPHYETLAPLWSLAVEEHFYIVWPFAVRFMSRASLLHLIGALLLLESILRAAVSIHHRSFSLVYYTTPFRLDGLLLGSLLAVSLESPAKKVAIGRFSASTAVGLAAVYIGMRVGLGLSFTKDANSSILYNVAVYPLVALGCAALVAYVLTHGESICARLLSFRPVVFLGSISYGVYLYQVPIKQIVTRWTGWTNRHAFFLDFPLTILFSWISFKVYERPFMVWGKRRLLALRKSVALIARARPYEDTVARVE
jgi:peptidoglycan/LPS O-acetylase OafA/YrhL